MAILSCVIKSSPDGDRKVLFDKLKELGVLVKDLKSVYTVNNADEVTFINEQALVKFLEVAPEEWNVISEYRTETLVTLAPVAGQGHALVDDSVVVFALSQRCTVLSGKRGFYKDYPEVEDGRRLFRVKDIKSLGSSLRFGSSVFSVSYKGQTPTCHKCGSEEHFARECEARKACFRCGSQEHEVRECDKGIKCDACHEFGHPFFKCPSSYANRVKMTSNWTLFEHETTDSECIGAAMAISQKADSADSSPNTSGVSITGLELTQLELGTLTSPEVSAGTPSVGRGQESEEISGGVKENKQRKRNVTTGNGNNKAAECENETKDRNGKNKTVKQDKKKDNKTGHKNTHGKANQKPAC